MEDPIMHPFRATLTASLLLLLAISGRLAAQPAGQTQPQSQDQTQPQTFQGEIEVREIGVVVEPPEGHSLGSVRPEDILVFEDGAPRPVVKAEPLKPGSGPSPWTLVLYFDQVLARPVTIHDAALALSRQARELTGLGQVEVVAADPEPKVELAATR